MPIGDQCEPNSEGEDGGEKDSCPLRDCTQAREINQSKLWGTRGCNVS